MPQTGRMYLCARCRAQVVVCRRCDRGQIYCTRDCARLARRAAQHAAAQRYQSSHRGRLWFTPSAVVDIRARRCDLHTIVTAYQGSAAAFASDLLRSDAG